MPEHKTGTREEWEAARAELAKLEAEQAERGKEIKKKRRELPWVPVEKEYEFDTEDGQEEPRRALRRPLAAARLQHHVRAGLHEGRLSRLHEASATSSTARWST